MAQTSSLLRLYQLKNGYAYNSDSLFLADFAKLWLKPKMQILDVGSGSGIIGLLCARHYRVYASLLDVNPYATFLSKLNAKTNNLTQYISNIFETNFLDSKDLGIFDCIISNPPFYRQGALNSSNPLLAQAKNSEFLPLQKWIPYSKKFLKPRGSLIFCYRPCDLGLIYHTLQTSSFNCECMRLVYPLQSKEASLVLIYARLGSKSPLRILPPFITHNSPLQTDFSDEAKQIYAHFKTYSIKVDSNDIDMTFLDSTCLS